MNKTLLKYGVTVIATASVVLLLTSAVDQIPSSNSSQDLAIVDAVEHAELILHNFGQQCYTLPNGTLSAFAPNNADESIVTSASQVVPFTQTEIGPTTSPWYLAYNSNFKQNVALLSPSYAEKCKIAYDNAITQYMAGLVASKYLKGEANYMQNLSNPQVGVPDGLAPLVFVSPKTIGNIVVEGTKAVAELTFSLSGLRRIYPIPQGPITSTPYMLKAPTDLGNASIDVLTATLSQNPSGQWQVILLQFSIEGNQPM